MFYLDYPVALYPQPTGTSCWSAAATMLYGDRSVGPGSANLANGGLVPDENNVQHFADQNNFTLHIPNRTPNNFTAREIMGWLSDYGPLWVGGRVPNLHAYVIGGVEGEGEDYNTFFKIYDPWPPGRGNITQLLYSDLLATFPMATMYLMHKKERLYR